MKIIRLFFIVFLIIQVSVFSQEDTKSLDRHEFTLTHQIETTPVVSQGRTGTCWAFAATSFIETELIRLGRGIIDLSEMFFVRKNYESRGRNYIRYHGINGFGQGGQAHDVMNVVKKHGMIPREFYDAKLFDSTKYNHSELAALLKAQLNVVLEKKGGKISNLWQNVYNATLDTYLGAVPENFKYSEKTYTPKEFSESLGFNTDDYIELTSYTHHPFYEKVILEIPDNYAHAYYYNVPIETLIEIANHAIETGFSVAWDGDSGRDHFLRDEGYAVIPAEEEEELVVDDRGNEMIGPEKERVITQEIRQEAFDDFSTTDDHLMHLVGLAKNQDGTTFYYTKNSWGSEGKKYNGYWYMSEEYFKLKTIALMVHKDALPDETKTKLGIK